MDAALDDLGERGQLVLARDAQLEVARGQPEVEQGPQGMGHPGIIRTCPTPTECPARAAPCARGSAPGETLFGAWAGLGSPASAELLGQSGLDWIVVDLEHGAATEADLVAHLTAIEVTGTVALVRPQSAERLRIGRALDLGAAGLVVPRLDTPDQVREAIGYLRYPPAGGRGVALLTRGGRLGAVNHAGVAALNDDIVGIVQIESPGALEAADEIASIDGVDVLFVGPADLSHSLGVPGQFAQRAIPGRRCGASSTPAGRTARPRGSSCTTPRASRRTWRSATRSSASGRTTRSCSTAPGPRWRPPADG